MQKNVLIIMILALCCGHVTSTALTPAQAAATAHARAAHDKHEEIDPAITAMIHDVIEQITIPKSIADYAVEGNWEKVMELATQPGIDLNSKDGDRTVLMLATYCGRLDVVTCLTSIKDETGNLKVDLNAARDDGFSVLMQAVKCGNLEVVRHLTQIKDASGKRIIALNAQDEDGDTALTLAEEQGASSEMATYLKSISCVGWQILRSVSDKYARCCCMD